MDFPNYPKPASPILTPWSAEFGIHMAAGANLLTTAASGVWQTANKAMIYPFKLITHETAYQLLWYVGAASSGNIDIGIYTKDCKRIISTTPTAMSATTNTVQGINIADTELPPGDYFLAGVNSDTTGTV